MRGRHEGDRDSKKSEFKFKLEVHLILTRLISLRNFITELEFSALINRWEEMVQLNLMVPEHQVTMQLSLINNGDTHKK